MATKVLPHDPTWAQAFGMEADAVTAAVAPVEVTLHHIGSTAVPAIQAKPIIDILGEASCLQAIDRSASRLEAIGYEAMGAYGIEGRRYFRKTAVDGVRTHHLHVFEIGAPQIARHLAFRDYLRAFPDRAMAYSALKARIVAGLGSDGATYQEDKAAFVEALNAEAEAWRRAERQAIDR
ncbi:MAG: GrpB family protein [Brevundimonas sp.]|jgi:GrpB-like predicted nucleotidyltransferase (UPF0157 family)|uniref:GrpB family protein n=1 Tax=Brevundimonas sp. TaxID=1871086 RepID=UPI0025C20DA7|nr:GrpB family protein [Brevundimonas sp.]MCH4267262.1 GrpB family protein [Brevundimonas sp.]